MIRDLITLPLRIAADVTRLGLRLTEDIVSGAAELTLKVIEVAVDRAPHPPAPEAPDAPGAPRVDIDVDVVRWPAADEPSTRRAPDSVRNAEESPREPEATLAPELRPSHVSEDAEFVEAFAEPGAEDGAGATVHVAEPWDGYREMTADDVVARLAGANAATLAEVELYERSHRARRTVIDAADRGLRH